MQNGSGDAQAPEGKSLVAVQLKSDCPHLESLDFEKISSNLNKGLTAAVCEQCNVSEELWMCLECFAVGCSRYQNSHMLHHHESSEHSITFGFEDVAFWCYPCHAYIISQRLVELENEWNERLEQLENKED